MAKTVGSRPSNRLKAWAHLHRIVRYSGGGGCVAHLAPHAYRQRNALVAAAGAELVGSDADEQDDKRAGRDRADAHLRELRQYR
ncbi:MAG: hypothetical protein WDM84_08225 [Bauldia sp.]